MKRILLRGTLVALVLLLGALVVVGILLKTLNPNDYKGEISAAVEKAIGRQVLFDGELQATFFPVLGIKTGRIRVMDDAVFGYEPFAEVTRTTLRMGIVPLLKGEIALEELLLEGVKIKLVKTATGKKNWQEEQRVEEIRRDREAQGVTALEQPAPLVQEQRQPEKKDGKPLSIAVDGVICRDITVSYSDLGLGAQYKAMLDEASLSGLAPGRSGALALAGYVEDGKSGTGAEFLLEGSVRIDTGRVTLMVNKFALEAGKGTTQGNSSPGLGLEATAVLELDATRHTMQLGQLRGSLQGSPISGEVLLKTAGNSDLPDGAELGIFGELHLGTLDLNGLQQAFAVPPKAVSTLEKPSLAPKPVQKEEKNKADANVVVQASPLAGLRAVQAVAAVSIKRLQAGGMVFENVEGLIKAEQGIVSVSPFTFGLAGGSCEASLSADGREDRAQWHADGKVQSLRVGVLLTQLASNTRAEGSGACSFAVDATGNERGAILKSLQGNGAVAMRDGTVALAGLVPADVLHMAGLEDRLPIETASAEFTLRKGVATTNSLLVRSPLAQVNGKGTVNYLDESMQLLLDVSVLGKQVRFPLSVAGPWSALHVSSPVVQGVEKLLDKAASSKSVQKVLKKLPKEAGSLLQPLQRKR